MGQFMLPEQLHFFERGEDFVVLEEAVLEIEAQFQRFQKLTGDKPHYFEVHAVFSNNFLKGLELVAKPQKFRFRPRTLG